jgi:hypothetical protein
MSRSKARAEYQSTRPDNRSPYRNLVSALLHHEQIQTTVPKAKEAARVAEKVRSFRVTSEARNQVVGLSEWMDCEIRREGCWRRLKDGECIYGPGDVLEVEEGRRAESGRFVDAGPDGEFRAPQAEGERWKGGMRKIRGFQGGRWISETGARNISGRWSSGECLRSFVVENSGL